MPSEELSLNGSTDGLSDGFMDEDTVSGSALAPYKAVSLDLLRAQENDSVTSRIGQRIMR